MPVGYTLTASSGANGSISPSGAVLVNAGASQTFTASPATGYRVNQWTLDGVVVQTGGGTYTVASVEANHTVGATFAPMTVAYLGDVLGAGKVTLADWVKIGRYAAGLDPQPTGLQYQEADCASGSVGKPINLADWVQAGRYAAGLDPLKPVPANSPTAPTAN
jgi:hypothetical protein